MELQTVGHNLVTENTGIALLLMVTLNRSKSFATGQITCIQERKDCRFYKQVFPVLYRSIRSNIIGSIFKYKRYLHLSNMTHL